MSSEKVIQNQVEAYNSRDIDQFVACHGPHVKLYNFGEIEPFCIGSDKLRSRYAEVFDSSPLLHTKIINRITMGNTVIDHEIVTGRAGVDSIEMVAIYTVENGLIVRADFRRK